MQQAINLNKQAAALMQKAMTVTPQAHALLTSEGFPEQGAASPVKQGQSKQSPKKQKQKRTSITKEASARIQSAADRRDGRTSSISAGYFRQFGSWDDGD